MTGRIVAVSCKPAHGIAKPNVEQIQLVAGFGVEGDAHFGSTVQHRSRVAKDPDQPNLRQVHLIHAELFAELANRGFRIAPGDMGENVTTEGLDLLALPAGAELALGSAARIRITGLRNPCKQLNDHAPGLMEATLEHAENGVLIRKAGIMGIVIAGGSVGAGDTIKVSLPAGEQQPLQPV